MKKEYWFTILFLLGALIIFQIFGWSINTPTGAVSQINPFSQAGDFIQNLFKSDAAVFIIIFIALFALFFALTEELHIFKTNKYAAAIFAGAFALALIVFTDIENWIITLIAFSGWLIILLIIFLVVWAVYSSVHKRVGEDVGEFAKIGAERLGHRTSRKSALESYYEAKGASRRSKIREGGLDEAMENLSTRNRTQLSNLFNYENNINNLVKLTEAKIQRIIGTKKLPNNAPKMRDLENARNEIIKKRNDFMTLMSKIHQDINDGDYGSLSSEITNTLNIYVSLEREIKKLDGLIRRI